MRPPGPVPVIARAVLLDKKGRRIVGQAPYAFIIVDGDRSRVLERVFASSVLREVVAFVRRTRSERGWGRVSFEPPPHPGPGPDGRPCRYEPLTIHEIFFASAALGQS